MGAEMFRVRPTKLNLSVKKMFLHNMYVHSIFSCCTFSSKVPELPLIASEK